MADERSDLTPEMFRKKDGVTFEDRKAVLDARARAINEGLRKEARLFLETCLELKKMREQAPLGAPKEQFLEGLGGLYSYKDAMKRVRVADVFAPAFFDDLCKLRPQALIALSRPDVSDELRNDVIRMLEDDEKPDVEEMIRAERKARKQQR